AGEAGWRLGGVALEAPQGAREHVEDLVGGVVQLLHAVVVLDVHEALEREDAAAALHAPDGLVELAGELLGRELQEVLAAELGLHPLRDLLGDALAGQGVDLVLPPEGRVEAEAVAT